MGKCYTVSCTLIPGEQILCMVNMFSFLSKEYCRAILSIALEVCKIETPICTVSLLPPDQITVHRFGLFL